MELFLPALRLRHARSEGREGAPEGTSGVAVNSGHDAGHAHLGAQDIGVGPGSPAQHSGAGAGPGIAGKPISYVCFNDGSAFWSSFSAATV
jgi:hypothetical protein